MYSVWLNWCGTDRLYAGCLNEQCWLLIIQVYLTVTIIDYVMSRPFFSQIAIQWIIWLINKGTNW